MSGSQKRLVDGFEARRAMVGVLLGRFSLVVWALLLVPGCALSKGEQQAELPRSGSAAPDQGLLTAYELLESTLTEESRLGLLGFLKKITFSRPVPEIEDIMTRLAETSGQRLEELEEVRRLSPDVSQEPNWMDPIGEAITSSATTIGLREMTARGSGFGVRFILLQAQATRMVYAISNAAADLETNRRRKKWLTDLAVEYEGFRDELVQILGKYIMQKGAAQQ